VEERPDATNVNNWHWTEKNACQWSKDKLKELLVDFNIETTMGTCRITELEKCEGDASANNRKAKIIIFFEWEIRLKWKAKLNNTEGDRIDGTIEIPNLSDENGIDDLDITFQTDSRGENADLLKQVLRTEATEKVQGQLAKYIQALKDEFTQGMILPKKDSSMSSVNASASNLDEKGKSAARANGLAQLSETKKSPGNLKFGKVQSSTTMKCTAQEVYMALTVPGMFAAFTNGSGKVDPKVGGSFEMVGGNVHGTFLELEEPQKIVQEWRFKHWPSGVTSKVTFTISQDADNAQITVNQEGVPEQDIETVQQGWENYYWSAMKKTFGFAAIL